MSLLEFWRKTEGKLRFIRRLPNRVGKNGGVQHWTPPSDTVIRTSNWTDIEVSEIHKDFDLPFDNPKSVNFMQELVRLVRTPDDAIILDFFAGSASTADAIMRLNANDGKNRRFIMVQLPETVTPYTDGMSTVADLAKTRIRLAGERLLGAECHPMWNKDIGFRVLKIDSSNMKDTYHYPHETSQDKLFSAVDNVKPDRAAEDLLFQVIVDMGIELTLPIRTRVIQNKTVFYVGDHELVACFERGVTADLIKELAKQSPQRVVFRDNGFDSDSVKVNVTQIFRQLSPSTHIGVI